MKYQPILFCTLLFITIGCTSQEQKSSEELISEAQAFFDSYATDLKAKNVEKIAGRYDRSGAYFLGNGNKSFQQYDFIRARYETNWDGPENFEWQDLSFDVINTDAILVLGKFVWTNSQSEAPLNFSYSGLLLRQDGELRIRLEDESVNPMDLKDYICPPDSLSMD